MQIMDARGVGVVRSPIPAKPVLSNVSACAVLFLLVLAKLSAVEEHGT